MSPAAPNWNKTKMSLPYFSFIICRVSLKKSADILGADFGGFTFSGGEPLAQAKFLLELINELKGFSNKNAQFITIIALYNPFNNKTDYFEGILKGEIINKPTGEGGFGYDPIFYIKDLNKTLAELTIEEKDNISHRGLALKLLKEYLNENINNF